MIVAGSEHGMQLLWVLFLSCLFTGVLMYAYGNYALVTNSTALYGFRKHLKLSRYKLLVNGISYGHSWNFINIFRILSSEGLQVSIRSE